MLPFARSRVPPPASVQTSTSVPPPSSQSRLSTQPISTQGCSTRFDNAQTIKSHVVPETLVQRRVSCSPLLGSGLLSTALAIAQLQNQALQQPDQAAFVPSGSAAGHPNSESSACNRRTYTCTCRANGRPAGRDCHDGHACCQARTDHACEYYVLYGGYWTGSADSASVSSPVNLICEFSP